jgi:hypothetical protein
MRMTYDHNTVYNTMRWTDAQSKEKTASDGGSEQGRLCETREEGSFKLVVVTKRRRVFSHVYNVQRSK